MKKISPAVQSLKTSVPPEALKFFCRAIVLITGWNLLYHLVLKPLQIPDAQLTGFVVWGTAKISSLFYNNVSTEGTSILINGMKAVNIDTQCNGLELIVLYIGFILCLPSTFKKMSFFIIAGTLAICVINMTRCAALAWMVMHMRQHVDFAHHYLFKLAVYAMVFYGWKIYGKRYAIKR